MVLLLRLVRAEVFSPVEVPFLVAAAMPVDLFSVAVAEVLVEIAGSLEPVEQRLPVKEKREYFVW